VSFISARKRFPVPWLFHPLVLLVFATSSEATIQYNVSLEHPEQHLFHVTMTIPDVKGVVTVQMAAWNALYQIRDFSAHVQQLEAFAGAEKAAIEKLDKQTWRIQGSGTITVRYATYWDEIGPFGTQLNAEHAFINPAMILLYTQTAVPKTWCLASRIHRRIGGQQAPPGSNPQAGLEHSSLRRRPTMTLRTVPSKSAISKSLTCPAYRPA
jgi:Peptidase M61 N-terminal domain